MNNYKVIITKESNGYFSAASLEYPIAIEEKDEKKAFKVIKRELTFAILHDIKIGRKVKTPVEDSFEAIEAIIKEYELDSKHSLIKEIDLSELLNIKEPNKTERVNISMPNYLKKMIDVSDIQLSAFVQKSIKKELGIN